VADADRLKSGQPSGLRSAFGLRENLRYQQRNLRLALQRHRGVEVSVLIVRGGGEDMDENEED